MRRMWPATVVVPGRLRLVLLDQLARRLVAPRDGQVQHQDQDAAEEEVARDRRAESEPAVLVAVLREEVADRRAQRPSHDVGKPEREHRVQLQREVSEGAQSDATAEDTDR